MSNGFVNRAAEGGLGLVTMSLRRDYSTHTAVRHFLKLILTFNENLMKPEETIDKITTLC